jgi:hypothetical protein
MPIVKWTLLQVYPDTVHQLQKLCGMTMARYSTVSKNTFVSTEHDNGETFLLQFYVQQRLCIPKVVVVRTNKLIVFSLGPISYLRHCLDLFETPMADLINPGP